MEHEVCKKMLVDAVTGNKTIQFLIDSIELLGPGCKFPENFMACTKCPDANMSGGFIVKAQSPNEQYKPQILVCENNKTDKVTFENTLLHELIHAYDKCRSKVNFDKCEQHACSEIRASALSGECNYVEELKRGHLQWQKGHQKCVRRFVHLMTALKNANYFYRRAEISVLSNPNCTNVGMARESVDAVFEKCYRDTSPFEYPTA